MPRTSAMDSVDSPWQPQSETFRRGHDNLDGTVLRTLRGSGQILSEHVYNSITQ